MKGKILGYNQTEGNGAISGEDGARYKFTATDWRGDKPPATGAQVDFAITEGKAIDVYPLGGIGSIDLSKVTANLDTLSGSEGGAKAAALFTQSLAVPLAMLVLLACFMTALSAGPDYAVKTFSFIGIGSLLDLFGAAGAAGEVVTGSLATVQMLMPLRFIAPLAALWAIWAAWAGKPLRLPQLVAGASALLAAALVFGFRSAILSFLDSVGGGLGRGMGGAMLSTGLSPWLLALAGIGLILSAIGIIGNPLARK